LLDFGGAGSSAVCRFGDDDLGLPLTRTSPYRLLERDAAPSAAAGLPAETGRRLDRDVVLRSGGNWEAAITALATTAGVDVVSDAFLCRLQPGVPLAPGSEITLAPRGVTLRDALDRLCEKYHYLW